MISETSSVPAEREAAASLYGFDDDRPQALMQRLRQETKPDHDAVETSVDLPKRLRDLNTYPDLLVRFYGLYAPLEEALQKHYAIHLPEIGMATRWKVGWLEQDLRHFGLDPATLPRYQGEFPLHNRAALLGVLYVIEGSSLGGQLIYRELQTRHDLTAETGARFFAGYGDQISAQWRGFGQAVNSLVCAYDAPQTVQSAKTMFKIFGDWMAQ